MFSSLNKMLSLVRYQDANSFLCKNNIMCFGKKSQILHSQMMLILYKNRFFFKHATPIFFLAFEIIRNTAASVRNCSYYIPPFETEVVLMSLLWKRASTLARDLIKYGWSYKYQPVCLFLEGQPAHILISKRHQHFFCDPCLTWQFPPFPHYLYYLIATLPQVMSCTSSNGSLPRTLTFLWGVILQLIHGWPQNSEETNWYYVD